jgi:uncharacterized membrane protein YccC
MQSPVLRHAVRAALALGSAYYLALALPWASHPHWLVLSVAVVLRGNLEQTLSRRNARVMGTMLGCAVVLGLAGGVIGILLGIGVSFLLSGVFGWPQLISPVAVAGSALFSMAIGVFFGYYPARQASRLDPIESLRYE